MLACVFGVYRPKVPQELKLTRKTTLSGQESPVTLPSLPPQHWDDRRMLPHLALSHGSRRSHADPYVGVANSLLTEPSP